MNAPPEVRWHIRQWQIRLPVVHVVEFVTNGAAEAASRERTSGLHGVDSSLTGSSGYRIGRACGSRSFALICQAGHIGPAWARSKPKALSSVGISWNNSSVASPRPGRGRPLMPARPIRHRLGWRYRPKSTGKGRRGWQPPAPPQPVASIRTMGSYFPSLELSDVHSFTLNPGQSFCLASVMARAPHTATSKMMTASRSCWNLVQRMWELPHPKAETTGNA